MKRKLFYILLACEAALCIIFCFVKLSWPTLFSSIMAFPFEQIAHVLRILSLSSPTGNVIAFLIYFIISLIPLMLLLIFSKKRKLKPEDILLIILTGILFGTLYYMINPGTLTTMMGNALSASILKAFLGVIIYSVIAGYILLRILRTFSNSDKHSLYKYLKILLIILNVIFVFVIFGTLFNNMISSFNSFTVSNTAPEQSLWLNYVFISLNYIISALPYIFNVFIVFKVMNLLAELNEDNYSDKSSALADSLSRWCIKALSITVVSNIIFNIIQLVMIKKLLVIESMVQIPIFSIVFVLATLLMAKYINENRKLKSDNDLFI